MNGFVQNTVFSPTSEGLRFLHFTQHSLAIFRKVHEFVQINVFSPRYARFVIFALGALLLSDFQQRFQPDISRFSRFCTGDTTSSSFQ